MSPNELGLVARHVAKLLVEHRFDELETATAGTRLSATDMKEACEEVGGPLVMPPDATWNALQVAAIRNWPGAWSVRFDLWTRNGRSRHGVELTVHERAGKPVIEIDDITLR